MIAREVTVVCIVVLLISHKGVRGAVLVEGLVARG